MKIVCASDTHHHHGSISIPECDLFVFAGDHACHREPIAKATISFNDWLGKIPAKHKVIVAGNHDVLFEKNLTLAKSLITNAIYLENDYTIIDEIKIYGSPQTPHFKPGLVSLPSLIAIFISFPTPS